VLPSIGAAGVCKRWFRRARSLAAVAMLMVCTSSKSLSPRKLLPRSAWRQSGSLTPRWPLCRIRLLC